MARSGPRVLDPERARAFLVSHHGLARLQGAGQAAVRANLIARRCIQLDPLEPLGTNADLVALARIDDIGRGAVYDAVLPGGGFEHFAKERCLLPASAFPWYRERAREVPWWRTSERMKRLDPALIEDVLAEVRDRGPVTAADLQHRGSVEPLDWNGWKSTSSASTMALSVLWIRCRVVVCGRVPAGKRYDLPERALPEVASAQPEGDFATWALCERAEAAGWMPTAGGPVWGQLEDVRSALPERLVAEGRLERVTLPGTRRQWLAPAGFLDRPVEEPDDRMRILGPLDPLLWDRELVRRVFGFDYVWEVYKPADQRKWGWYVCPLLHRGRLVGRIDARYVDGEIRVARRWVEEGAQIDEEAYRACLERHAACLRAGAP